MIKEVDMNKKLRLLADLIAVMILVAIDQLTKSYAVNSLKDKTPVILIRGVLQLYYLPNGNTGAAFGILSGHRVLFLLIATLVVGVIVYALISIPDQKRFVILRVLLVFIAAGGIGNMIDRFMLGYVIDFIYFYLINFPIFNVADCYVTVATISVALLILFRYKDEDFKLLEKELKFKKKREQDNE